MVNGSPKKAVISRQRILTRKLFRDMKRSAMQFIAMLLLCFLGTWCFCGLDANWRTMDKSFQTYFDENNVADFWIKSAGFSALELTRIENVNGLEETIARTSLTADCPDLGDDVTVIMHAYDGEMTINIPYLKEGKLLDSSDKRGVLVEEQFAKAHNLRPGDYLMLNIANLEIPLIVRGIILSPEYIVTSKDIAPTPETYGYVLLNHCAAENLPLNEVIATVLHGADKATVKASLNKLLPAALILTVNTNSGTSTSVSFVDMFRNMSYLFPVLVYAIATMIVVSTMKRMIENQRIQLGTLNALGYSSGEIRRHYMAYALIPSLIGSFTGLFAGLYTLPDVIWEMLAHNARMPYMLRSDISPISWCAFAGTVILSLFVCFIVYEKAAKETTAALLRPKPPKGGTRILLERWHWLWTRLSFNAKMIIRNIFRNFGRSFLSFVGVFCCNMLIVCSFSLQYSIPTFINAYYSGTQNYDIKAELESGNSGTLESYQARLNADAIDGIMEISISAEGPLQTRACLMTVIPENQDTLYLGKDQTLIAMPEDGVCVSKKLCSLLGLSIGDNITVYIVGDDEPLSLTIKNYADTNLGQGIFIGKTMWENCRKGDFSVTSLLIRGPSESIIRELNDSDEISALKYPSDQCAQTLSIMDSTTLVFSILSGAALFLAFIICYNMGLLNFTERTRDYATLKVLGYHRHEIRKLMLREQGTISLIGVLLSIRAGMVLTDIILRMCEYDTMVWAACYNPQDIIKACIISMAFTLFVELFLTRKVDKIDMVEALKSVE